MLHHLSPELIELVLTHLDRFSLKSCLEVSKTFHDIIIHSPPIMSKLTLRLDDKSWMSKLDFIRNYGRFVKNVEIYSNNQSCLYFRLLHLMPKIVKLKLDFTASRRFHPQRSFDFDHDEILMAQMHSLNLEFPEDLELTKLENFNAFFYNVDPTVIFQGMKKCISVKKLCIRCSCNAQPGYESIVEFLCLQTNLKSLELKIARMDLIFSAETIDKIKCKLECLRLVPSYYAECDYTYLNEFLTRQSENLEELRVFSWGIEDEICDSIGKLTKLKRLTTHGILPQLGIENTENFPKLSSLQHFRYYKGNRNENLNEISTNLLPNLQSLNVHFGIDHRLFEHHPDVKVTENPLRKLKNLREFHIESENQDLLHYLASPRLEKLVIKCEDVLFDIASWTRMAKNLPKLQFLTIVEINDEKFLNFILKNHENFIQKIRGLKVLELHYSYEDVLTFYVDNGRTKRAVGICCYRNSILMKKIDTLKKTFENFDLIVISKDEYEEKYEHLQFYFHSCGP